MPKTKRPAQSLITNRLWLARKRRGLEQKQVAYLLKQSSLDQISRYERGERLPPLDIACKLAIIYGTPLRLLFQELFGALEAEVRQRINESTPLRQVFGTDAAIALGPSDYCAYVQLLALPNASEADRTRVRQHVTVMAKALAGL